jgi:hypothetical protein
MPGEPRLAAVRRNATVLLTVTFVAAGVACSSSSGSPDAGSGDGGVDLERPPMRPTVEDGLSGPERIFVLDGVEWHADDWSTVGLDLDGLDTREPSEVECHPPRDSAPLSMDGVRGIDNSFGHHLAPPLAIADPGSVGAQAAQSEGRGALLVRVRGWSGEPDDPRVDAAVMTTVGLDASGGLDVTADALLAGDLEQPRIRDDNAYVADGVIVVRMPDRVSLPVAFADGYVWLRLTDATLVFTSSGRATLAGRWLGMDILAGGIPVCPGSPDYMGFERLLENAVDVRAIPGTGGDGVACDAISVGLAFDANPATLGGVGGEIPIDACP